MHTVPFEPFDILTFPAMCRSRSPWAYAFRKLPCEVTRNIESFRDFTLEDVIKNGGTPSALAIKAFRITNNGAGRIDIGHEASDWFADTMTYYRNIWSPLGFRTDNVTVCWERDRTVLAEYELRCRRLM